MCGRDRIYQLFGHKMLSFGIQDSLQDARYPEALSFQMMLIVMLESVIWLSIIDNQ